MEHGARTRFKKESVTDSGSGLQDSRESAISSGSQKLTTFGPSRHKQPVEAKPSSSPTKKDTNVVHSRGKSLKLKKFSKKSGEQVGTPSRDKIVVTEWDKGMKDITSEEELKVLKSLPTEYSGIFVKDLRASREQDRPSSIERFRRPSIPVDKRISFEPRQSTVPAVSSSSISLISRSKSESLASEDHSGSSYISGTVPFQTSKDFGKETEDKREKGVSKLFNKIKNICKRRQKQHDIYKPSTADQPRARFSEERESAKSTKVKFSGDERAKPKLGSTGYKEGRIEEEEEEEIQYDVDPREVMNCLRQVSRPDGLSISGEICIGKYRGVHEREETRLIPIKDTDTPATFLYRLGINMDKAEAMFVKNCHLNGRLHAAIIEASIWTRTLTKSQAVLILHLAEKIKPSVIGWYPHLIEAIVNSRITTCMQINGYLQTLENMSEEKTLIPVKETSVYSSVSQYDEKPAHRLRNTNVATFQNTADLEENEPQNITIKRRGSGTLYKRENKLPGTDNYSTNSPELNS